MLQDRIDGILGTAARPDSECVLELKEDNIVMEFYNYKQEGMDGVLELQQEPDRDEISVLQQEQMEMLF
jgi:hypothetical protein